MHSAPHMLTGQAGLCLPCEPGMNFCEGDWFGDSVGASIFLEDTKLNKEVIWIWN